MASNRGSLFSWLTDFETYSPYNEVRTLVTRIKILFILVIFSIITVLIASNEPSHMDELLVALEPNKQVAVRITKEPTSNKLCLEFTGNINLIATTYPDQSPGHSSFVKVHLDNYDKSANVTLWKSGEFSICISENENEIATVDTCYILNDIIISNARLTPGHIYGWNDENILFRTILKSNAKESIGFRMIIDSNPLSMTKSVGLGLLLLIFLYILIAFTVLDRTLAAILSSTAAIAMLCMMDKAPKLEQVASWIDMDTLIFIFCMMIMMSVLSQTGFLDYITMIAYKVSRGHVWWLLFYLYMFTGLMSALWTTVTTVLLVVPITERLCEVLGLHTPLVLLGVAIFANIGGTLTPLGCHPNFIVTSNRQIQNIDVHFVNFTMHMLLGVFISMLVSFVLFCYMVRNKLIETTEQKLNRLIKSYQRRLLLTSKRNEETEIMEKRISELRENLIQHRENIFTEHADFETTLKNLQEKHMITDRVLLIKCCIAFGFVFFMLFLHELPLVSLGSVCWCAILALVLLIILIDVAEMDSLLEDVEWSVLIFLACLYVFMHALEILGLIDWIGEQTFEKITNANSRIYAILILLWVSAVASALVNNVPIASVLSRVVVKLAYNNALNLPLAPLTWAICFGAGFGANANLLGSSTNIVTHGLAYRKGHNIKFKLFLFVGIPIMISTCVIATIYLLLLYAI